MNIEPAFVKASAGKQGMSKFEVGLTRSMVLCLAEAALLQCSRILPAGLLSILLLSTIQHASAYAVDEQTDSLEALFATAQNDTERVELLYAISRRYRNMDNLRAAKEYGDSALELSRKIKNEVVIAKCLNNMGIIYRKVTAYEEALIYLQEALNIYGLQKDSSGMAMALGNIGTIYDYQGDYVRALEYHMRAFEINDRYGNKKQKAANLGNIGILYAEKKKDYSKALDFFKRGLKIYEVLSDSIMMAICYNNIGEYYSLIGEHLVAIGYHKKALALSAHLKNVDTKATAMLGLSKAMGSLRGNTVQAELAYLDSSLLFFKSVGVLEKVKDTYLAYSGLYKRVGDYAKALQYLDMSIQLNDSLLNIERIRSLNQMEIKYESAKKEKQLVELKAEKEKQDIQNRFLLGVSGLIFLLFSVTAYGLVRIRRDKRIIQLQKLQVETQHKEIMDSIVYAEKIQKAILPRLSTQKRLLPDAFVLFRPKEKVSGDFYWIEESNGKVFFAVADCTGHGIPGAFMSMICARLLNEALLGKGITRPADILLRARTGIIDSLKHEGKDEDMKDGMDISLCAIDTAARTLEYAGANNSLYVVRGEGRTLTANGNLAKPSIQSNSYCLYEIKADKQPVGFHIGERKPYSNHELPLDKGDILYLFSDGYADQFGGDSGKKFMTKRFRNLLLSICDQPMSEQQNVLDEALSGWMGGREQIDDVCVLGIRL